jgi:dihydropteroate synthase
VLPVIAELARRDIAVSVDTTRARVAQVAIEAGALLVNDVSGGLADPAMASVIGSSGKRWVRVHRRGSSQDMYAKAQYNSASCPVEQACRIGGSLRA